MVLWHGRSCKEILRTLLRTGEQKRLNSYTKSPHRASMTTTLKKKNWDLLVNCQKYALKLSWNACIWHALEDQTFHGQKTDLHEQSPIGPELVTNAWIVWFLIFITRVNTNNIVMWEILLSNADWDCFRSMTLPEILKIQNPLLEEHYVFLEVIHLFQCPARPQIVFELSFCRPE